MSAPRTGSRSGARRPGALHREADGPAASGAPRQRQRERADTTVRDLVRPARTLFVAAGYAATPFDKVCERTGAADGAAHHTERGAARAIGDGAVSTGPPGPLTSLLYGGPSESAMAVARAEDPPAMRREALDGLRRSFDAIARG